MPVCISDVLDENQSKLSEDLMEFRRDASMLNVRVCALLIETNKCASVCEYKYRC